MPAAQCRRHSALADFRHAVGIRYAVACIIKTIPLATYDPPVGQTVTATGWGKRFDQDRGSDILQVVELPVMNQNECNYCFDGYIKAGMICVSGTDRKGACNVRKLSNYFFYTEKLNFDLFS